MADSLVLTGVKQVTKHTGSEMQRVNPKRGGDVHKIKRWWTPGTVNTVYEACTLFKVTQAAGVAYLAVKTSQAETFRIRIDLKDDFTFNFYNNLGISRAALFNENMQLIEHYVFPAISGGKIMTVTPPGGATRPEALVAVSVIGTTVISGSVVNGETLTATAPNYSGGVGTVTTNLAFQASATGSGNWSTLEANPGVPSGGTATYTVTGSEVGKYIRARYTITDDQGNNNKNSAVTSVVTDTLDNRIANATYSYNVSVVNTAAEGDPAVNVYVLDPDTFGANQPNLVATVGESIAFNFSAVASAHPLGIFTDSSKTTPVTVGVETGGAGNATLLFTPPIAGSFSYQCINHANMGGDITVS